MPYGVGCAGDDVVALHARLVAFEHSKEIAALVSAGLIHRVHIPIARVGDVRLQLGIPIGDRTLLKERIAEGHGRGFIVSRPG